MRDRLTETRAKINALRDEVRGLIAECRKHDGREWVHAQIDLGYAENDLDKAQQFVSRLLVNGKKPWDTTE